MKFSLKYDDIQEIIINTSGDEHGVGLHMLVSAIRNMADERAITVEELAKDLIITDSDTGLPVDAYTIYYIINHSI
jgi:hypothetical protein